MDIGYARVSSTRGDLARQLDVLRGHGIPEERIHRDTEIGATPDRPGFDALLRDVDEGDTIVVTKLDRLGCNVSDCLSIVADLCERGVKIRTLNDPVPIDAADPSALGELAVGLLVLLGQMQRVFQRERAARARELAGPKRGRRGPPHLLDPEQVAAARAALADGASPPDVAQQLGVARSTLYRYLKSISSEDVPPASQTGSVDEE